MKYYSGLSEAEMVAVAKILNDNNVYFEVKASNALLIGQAPLRKLPETALESLKKFNIVPEPEGSPIILDVKHGTKSQFGESIGLFILMCVLGLVFLIFWLTR